MIKLKSGMECKLDENYKVVIGKETFIASLHIADNISIPLVKNGKSGAEEEKGTKVIINKCGVCLENEADAALGCPCACRVCKGCLTKLPICPKCGANNIHVSEEEPTLS